MVYKNKNETKGLYGTQHPEMVLVTTAHRRNTCKGKGTTSGANQQRETKKQNSSSSKQGQVRRNRSSPVTVAEVANNDIPMHQRKISRNHSSPLTSKDQNKQVSRKQDNFTNTKSHTRPISSNVVRLNSIDSSFIVSMDCEMVGIGFDGLDSMLARVSIVDWNGTVVLDQYVQPDQPVVDYRTHVSGITAKHLIGENVVDIVACRFMVLEILEGKILVGHGLKNDLHALGISHPWHMIRDTAKYEPFMKVRFTDGVLWPRKLKELCTEFLNIEIQPIGKPHSSCEDSIAALDLYKSVQMKWENLIRYKVMKTALIMEQHQHQNQPNCYS